MSTDSKDVIYLDVDDEITSIIDKVRSSKQKIVALVLPKRATMLQSSVNMKLLKRAGEQAKKQLVLITTEASLLPLAGIVGLYAARNLQSKPEIPVATGIGNAPEMDQLLTINESTPGEFNSVAAADKPIGDLAAGAVATAAAAEPTITGRYLEPDDTVELDNSDTADAAKYSLTPAAAAEASTQTKTSKLPKDKKLQVPNFLRFRRRLVLAVLILLLLIGGFIAAAIILPHATITLATNSSNINSDVRANLDPNVKALNLVSGAVPSEVQQTQKTASQQVAATGQKNLGNDATGNVTITNCSSAPVTFNAGTGFSAGNKTYISQSDVTVPQSSFLRTGSQIYSCNNDRTASVNVTAQNPGASYNQPGGSYTINNNPDPINITAQGNAMSGGTDNIVKVVQQADIDNATKQITAQNKESIKSSLANELTAGGYQPIPATFTSGSPSISSSAQPGEQADNVTVTSTITYFMYGVNQTDLKTLVDTNIAGQINTAKQGILNDGLGSAQFNVLSESASSASVKIQSTALIGPKLNTTTLKSQAAGHKSGDVETVLGANPGISSVSVHLSPFWVSTVPKNPSKITIKFIKGGSNK